MDTPAISTKYRLIVVGSWVLSLTLLILSVKKCAHYQTTAKAYRDSTAYYKVESAKVCQQKLDSLKTWYLQTKAQDEALRKNLRAEAPAWLR